ncbi:MAG: DUF4815 domain-containing protein, partial [Patescibacteria group bacterium]|nr:DUF4815 domain-containing protein [Patescibacteria group bacterium]
MAIIKQLKASPFFDDFDPEVKDFLRVLFRPGRAVQTRELNQLQSILQTQIERFANHIFKDGSIIYGGGTTIDTISARYLKVEDYIPDTSNILTPSVYVGKRIRGKTSGAVALIVAYAEREGADPKTFIIKELNGNSFIGGEILEVVVQDTNGNYIADTAYPSTGIAKLLATNFYGKSSTVSVSDGIFFTKGMFVICNSQTVPLDKYSNVPNKKAGLISQVQIITENEDPTLLDNATGTYNYSAPGASRLKISLVLTSKDLNYVPSPDEDFIELLETREGKLYKQISRPTYNELMKTLARRTFNESGNYTVRPFILTLEDHPTDDNKLRAYLSPGLAYIGGFEFETIATQYIDINKARDTESIDNYGVSVYYDQYFLVNKSTANGVPIFSVFTPVQIRNSSNTVIGTCNIRSIEHHDSNTYRLYVFNLKLNSPYTISNINNFFVSGVLLYTISGTPTLYGPANNLLIYNTGFAKVQSCSDISVTYKKTFTGVTVNYTSGSTGTINLTLTGNEEFLSSPTNFIVINQTSGTHFAVQSVSLSSANQNVQLVINTTSSFTASVVADIRNRNATHNVKTPVYVKNSKGYVAQAATNTSTIKLSSKEPSVSGFYTNCRIRFISGTGASSTIYQITSYNETTKEITISGGPVSAVGTNTYYEIIPEMDFNTTDLGRGYIVHTLSSTLNDQTPITLTGMYDGISLVRVMRNMNSYSDWFDTTKDITYMFEFYNGQTDEYYGPCTIKLASGYTLPSGTKLHIFVNRFVHTIN